jgi:hypothetical protein
VATRTLSIGIELQPRETPFWTQIEAYLAPAAERGGVPLLDDDETCWTVFGWEGFWTPQRVLLGAATVRRTEDAAEVVLVGGRNFRRWLKPLDEMLARWARDTGAVRMIATGRKGWCRELGWNVMGHEGDFYRFERRI